MQFRTKARAVDLLGKGQIADLPTAITELWKNGYDAYADNLKAELFLPGYKGLESPFFVISDDGTGMTKSDIFDKWLVLGVDSKSRSSQHDIEGEDTLWKKPRIKAGEKGIGRLSVAFLGSPMLMLTKKQGYPIQALYFDWRLLENYNMFLDDVNIPVDKLDVNNFRDVLDSLKSQFLDNLIDGDSSKWEQNQAQLKQSIFDSTYNLLIPYFFESEILSSLSGPDAHGTKFIIFEPEEQIINWIKSSNQLDDDINDSNFVRTSLVGFTNQFKPKDNRLPVDYSFLIHEDSDELVARNYFIESGMFFDEKDYDIADIVIDGRCDGRGTFHCSLRIYDKIIPYSFTNPRKKDKRSDYGEFSVKIGYSMGKERDALFKGDAWTRINNKVNTYGGIYIYRDGFRVLPYGRADADFLGLEERRSKRFSSFFSYRRMFGYIELSRNINSTLKDKSSREGLINNAAYRAFKDDLSALFIDLAIEFFGDKPKQSIFLDEKERHNTQSDVIKQDKLREKQEKSIFSRQLNEFPALFDTFQKEYEEAITGLKKKLKESDIIFSDIETLLSKLQELDLRFDSLLPKLPKRYELTERQRDRLEDYASKLSQYKEIITSNEDQIIRQAKERLQMRDLKTDFANRCNKYIASIEDVLSSLSNRFQNKIQQLSQDIHQKGESSLDVVKTQKSKGLERINSFDDVQRETASVRDVYESQMNQISDSIESLITHIERMSLDVDEELLQGAYKEQYNKIKEQWELTRETSQLGIAVEIIDHEFKGLYAQIDDTLGSLSKDIDSSDFNFLKKTFKTLEEKYTLLSPLYRISGSNRKDINCKALFEYLKCFFQTRLEHVDTFYSTDSFKKHSIFIKEPVINSVLINIVNNALYWIKNSDRKIIEFDYYRETDEIIIRNSGQTIPEYKLTKIFELFYSNRPNGRGLGLYLAKQSLNECYFDIYATNDPKYNTLGGACFVIKPLKID
jgi:signal transduction histidine kinase